MGDEGAARERAIVERVRAAGAVLIGPNCLGIHDSGAELELCSEELESGSIGLISQSGNLALEIGMVGAEFGLGFSRFVSLGNQADVQAAELIESFAAHEPTKLIAVYLEDFRDGREFARAGKAAVDAGTPVVLLAGGATEASARAAQLPHGRARQRPRVDQGAPAWAPGSSSWPRRRRSSTSPWACSPTGGRRAGGSPSPRTAAATPSSRPTSSSPRAWSCPSCPRPRAPSFRPRSRTRRRS